MWSDQAAVAATEVISIGVVVCDDHDMVREALAERLGAEPDIDVLATARSETEAIEMLRSHRPDVAIIDARLGDGDGIAVAQWASINLLECRTVIVTGHPSDEAVVRAYEANASAFIAKLFSFSELLSVVRDVASGIHHLSPETARAASRRVGSTAGPLRALDANDRAILSLLAAGKRDREIAAEVFLSVQTVRNRISRMLGLFELDNRVQLAVHWSRQGPGSGTV